MVSTDSGERALFDEALAFLADTDLRSAYDRMIAEFDHLEALARLSPEDTGNLGYEPIIRSYCAFCKFPHSRNEADDRDASCSDCGSPLFPPPRALREVARRALSRISRSGPVTLFYDWPARGILSKLVDLSPVGMKCESTAQLSVNDTVKVVSNSFDAVGSVAHVLQEPPMTISGMRFLAVRFRERVGNFTSLKA